MLDSRRRWLPGRLQLGVPVGRAGTCAPAAQVHVGVHVVPVSRSAPTGDPVSHHMEGVDAAHIDAGSLQLLTTPLADSFLIWEPETLPLHWTPAGMTLHSTHPHAPGHSAAAAGQWPCFWRPRDCFARSPHGRKRSAGPALTLRATGVLARARACASLSSAGAGIQDWPGQQPLLAAALSPEAHAWLVVDQGGTLAAPARPARAASPGPQPASPAARSASEGSDFVLVKPEPSFEDLGEPFTMVPGRPSPPPLPAPSSLPLGCVPELASARPLVRPVQAALRDLMRKLQPATRLSWEHTRAACRPPPAVKGVKCC